MNNIEKEQDNLNVWKFRKITAYEGSLASSHPSYKYNGMIELETREITTEPLKLIASKDHVTCALFWKDINLLEEDRWRRFKNIAKR